MINLIDVSLVCDVCGESYTIKCLNADTYYLNTEHTCGVCQGKKDNRLHMNQLVKDLIEHIQNTPIEESIESIQSMNLDSQLETTLCEFIYASK